MYDFGREMYFDVKAQGNKSNRDRNLIKLPKSPGLIISASGISSTIILPSDLNELCNRFKLLQQEKQAGINLKITSDEIFAIVYKLLEYKCLCKKQHKHILMNCNLLQTKEK